MPMQAAESLLADPNTSVGQFLDVLTWLDRDILHLRARKKCAQKEEYIAEIDTEINEVQTTIERIRRRIEEKCTN